MFKPQEDSLRRRNAEPRTVLFAGRHASKGNDKREAMAQAMLQLRREAVQGHVLPKKDPKQACSLELLPTADRPQPMPDVKTKTQ